MKIFKTFNDFYSSEKFNSFRSFIESEYKVKMVLSHFDSYLIYKEGRFIHELEFEVDYDNAYDSETANIVNLCMIMIAMRADAISHTEKFYEDTTTAVKIIKARKLFGKVVAKTENIKVTYTKRDKHYHTYETELHEQILKNYELYPA